MEWPLRSKGLALSVDLPSMLLDRWQSLWFLCVPLVAIFVTPKAGSVLKPESGKQHNNKLPETGPGPFVRLRFPLYLGGKLLGARCLLTISGGMEDALDDQFVTNAFPFW